MVWSYSSVGSAFIKLYKHVYFFSSSVYALKCHFWSKSEEWNILWEGESYVCFCLFCLFFFLYKYSVLGWIWDKFSWILFSTENRHLLPLLFILLNKKRLTYAYKRLKSVAKCSLLFYEWLDPLLLQKSAAILKADQ